jgi:enoyl-CoA hydratase
MSAEVLVERLGHVQVITLNRPSARNALNAEVGRGVAQAIDDAEGSDEIRVSVLTGTGGCFSSGMDLRAFLDGETPEVGERGLCGITAESPSKPLIGAAEGWALAAGLELLLACDVVIAGAGTRLGLPEVTRGLFAGGGGAISLPRRIPFACAMQMLLTGDPIDAERAAALGLVSEVVPAGKALQRSMEIAERIGRNGPMAVRATKAIARLSQDQVAVDIRTIHDDLKRAVVDSWDAREGARAFAEGRAPEWSGT